MTKLPLSCVRYVYMDLPCGEHYNVKSIKVIGVNTVCFILQKYEEAKFSVLRNFIRRGNRLEIFCGVLGYGSI
jgi:hypothetical protein